MSRYRRHVGGVAILLACIVLAYIVLRPDSLEKPGPQQNPVPQQNDQPPVKVVDGNSEPKKPSDVKPPANGDEAAGPAAEQNAETDTRSSSPDKTATKAAAKAPRPPKELFAGWEAPAVVLMLTGEMHGYIEPCGCSVNQLGGLSRRADLLRQIDARGWPATALDVGGLVNYPNRRQGKFKFDMILKCLVDMRYAGIAMGVEELQLGFDFLTFHDPEKLPFLSANMEFFKDPKFPVAPLPSRVVTVGTVKIGVTAVFGPDLEEKARPGGQAAAGGFEFEILPAVASIKKQLAALEPQKPDLLVLLSHARYDETKKLAESFPQFDIVVTAGGPEDPDINSKFLGKKTLLIAPGQKGKHVPIVGFYPKAGKDRLRYELVDLDDKRFKDSPAILEHMKFYQFDMLKGENVVATEPAIEDPRNVDPMTGLLIDDNPFVGVKVCAECHKSAMEVWETSKHAEATETLKTGGPRHDKNTWINRIFDPECVACHVTGWDTKKVVRYNSGYTGEDTTPQLLGQQCENCHGAGGRHVAAERQFAKDQKATDDVVAWRKFQRLSKKTAFDLCVKCHDGDNDPEFGTTKTFEEYWDQIAHPGRD